MSNMFEGKVAFITGGVGGIGQEYTKALLRNKLKGVALIDINEIAAENFQNDLVSEFGHGKTIFIKTDITDIVQVHNAFEETIKHFNQLDIVINNAGIADEIDLEKTININLTAVTRITTLALETYLPRYKLGEEGFVVNTSSIGGLVPLPFGPAYSVSKHGVVTLGRCLGTPSHYKRTQVKVLTICPGKIDTDLPVRRPQQYLDILEPLKKLIHEKPIKIELLGDTLIKVIRDGSNGSIWVLDQHKPEPYMINYPSLISTF